MQWLMMAPVYSSGATIVDLIIGSMTVATFCISPGSGKSAGLSTVFSTPFLYWILTGTRGRVTMTSSPNSSSRRWRKTSMWRLPLKPSRKPWPRNDDDSRFEVTLRSVSVSRRTASSSLGNPPGSTG